MRITLRGDTAGLVAFSPLLALTVSIIPAPLQLPRGANTSSFLGLVNCPDQDVANGCRRASSSPLCHSLIADIGVEKNLALRRQGFLQQQPHNVIDLLWLLRPTRATIELSISLFLKV